MDSTSPENKPGSGAFTTTHWSVVLQAGQESSPESRDALERLCKAYRYPLYVHARRLGWGPEDAEDMVQKFLVRFIERKYLQRADPDRGRFRSFLLTSLKHFLADEWRKGQAEIRGGGQKAISWEGVDPEERYRMEPACAATPDQIYEKRWAATLLEGVLDWMRAECDPARVREFDLLKDFVWGAGQSGTYSDVAAQLGVQENAVKVRVHRLRKDFGQRLRMEVLRTVSSPAEVDAELRHLRSVLSS